MIVGQYQTPAIEHDELVDMRTHLTVAVLAAAQLRRTVKDVPEAARFDAYLDRALDNLVEDVRKIDALVAQTEPHVPARAAKRKKLRLLVRLVYAPLRLVRQTAGACWRWAQRRRFIRMSALTVYD